MTLELEFQSSIVWDLGGLKDQWIAEFKGQQITGNIRLERSEFKEISDLRVLGSWGTSDLTLVCRDQGLRSGIIPMLWRLEPWI